MELEWSRPGARQAVDCDCCIQLAGPQARRGSAALAKLLAGLPIWRTTSHACASPSNPHCPPLLQVRRAPGCTELLHMFDGDHNGVCWHLGTAGCTQPWVNPVLAGRLQVRLVTGWLPVAGWRRHLQMDKRACSSKSLATLVMLFLPASRSAGPAEHVPHSTCSPKRTPYTQVRASSPACRSTDPRALAGSSFARCNFAGPRVEGGQLSR